LYCFYIIIKVIPIKRFLLQSIKIKEPLRYRFFGLAKLSVETLTKTVSEDLSEQKTTIDLMPLVPKKEAQRFIEENLSLDLEHYNSLKGERIPKRARFAMYRWSVINCVFLPIIIFLFLYIVKIPVLAPKKIEIALVLYFILLSYSLLVKTYKLKNNEIDKATIKALGFDENAKVKYEDVIGKEFSVVENNNYYRKIADRFVPRDVDTKMYDSGTKVKVVAILKAKDSFTRPQMTIGYTRALQKAMIEKEAKSDIVVAQQKDKTRNIITNQKMDGDTAEQVLATLGAKTAPSAINIYPRSFNDRDKIAGVINDFNKKVAEKYGLDSSEYHKYSITYADLAKQMTTIMSQMINTISLILSAFAGISLIVSSIMIGILTYVSVVKRTKESGILRAIGARKKDITRIFIAEAGLIGFISGAVGVAVTMLLAVPISGSIAKALKVEAFTASLNAQSSIGLILLSLVLTLIASIIPSRIAAKKDPVEALRTE